jgi:hypothetical protein
MIGQVTRICWIPVRAPCGLVCWKAVALPQFPVSTANRRSDMTASPRNSRAIPHAGQVTITLFVSRKQEKSRTLGPSTNPPSAVTRPSTAPWISGHARLRQRQSRRVMTGHRRGSDGCK